MRTYIKSSEFQSRSELLIIENCLPLTDEVTVDLVLKCLQHLHLLALHLEILGYIPHLLNGLEEGICTEDAECNLRGYIEILILFEKLIECCKKMIPSREERYSYRF